VLLVIAHAQYYPDQPFCPWLLGTELVQHIIVRQRILLSGKFKVKWVKQTVE
jgi:hypothetical protein